MRVICVQHIKKITSQKFYALPVVPIKLGKVMKYEAKKKKVNYYFLNDKH